ncbi:trypsin-like peptidase domain-containing protein [Candidatus Uhrbacteria bacterium]|nr:trypsin-like peptidase domain-containing protein [Candidatus Uhrbacteria bacterium]
MPEQTPSLPPVVLHALSGAVGALVILVVLWSLASQGILLIPTASQNPTTSNPSAQAPNVTAMDVSDVVSKINPAVVSIVITKDVPVLEQYYEDPFSQFFGGNSSFHFRIPKYRQNGTQQKDVGGGSGFFISRDGYVVTNAHVVSDKEAQYTVFSNEEKKFDAKVVAVDDVLDIALLKVEGTDLPFLTFGDSDQVRLGQAVIAIGNALGEFRNTVSTGVISGLSRSIVASSGLQSQENLDNVFQTDAAINPGNSGGPLVNLAGEVIGVNVAMASNSENIGFSLPANAVRQSVESMKTNGRAIRPYLGVRYVPVTDALKTQNHLSVDHGALVLRGQKKGDLAVIPGSPADKASVEENDIILQIDGKDIDEKYSLTSLIREKKVGDEVSLKILHDGAEKTIRVKLEESPQ